ncbi:MAG: tRNA preQ1(34) S-adenosylmethionine ribosyltransferase-isomerase QueA [Alphaproteobacteria bacterium]|nr:tRNA preQ1(34) S-adenosylmethionine ribosyltransferase-isomerase QueA [Alphaproteobacteria bacterium]
MRVDLFDFDLPRTLIAARPALPRDAARLLEVDEELTDRAVTDLPTCLHPGDLLVVNDTRVIPASLSGRRGAAAIEATLHKKISGDTWRAFARPAKRLKQGNTIDFSGDLVAEVVEKGEAGEVTLRFNVGDDALLKALKRQGRMPLPPYIPRPDGPDARDREDYQTVFATHPGAVAAPTAGLHFTPALLDALAARGIAHARVTLHVGAGTFLPVKVEDTVDHRMHAEWGQIAPEAVDAVNTTRASGGRVVAVGTTALRLLESASGTDGRVAPFVGETTIFITPGYRFRAVDLLLTNFHLPRSTLFMLVAAFSGLRRMRAAYDHAIRTGYRFYSYGDACLLHRHDEEIP